MGFKEKILERLQEVRNYNDLELLEEITCNKCRRPRCHGCDIKGIFDDYREYVLPALVQARQVVERGV
ncbi:MAG: hypothetical protein AB1330_01390 [Bacillota bacterium]